MSAQAEFSFESNGPEKGYTQWVTGRQMAVDELARRIHLPLGHQVEIWLYGGVRLRGKLRLKDNLLFIEEDKVRHLELLVGSVPFTYREMESCIRTD